MSLQYPEIEKPVFDHSVHKYIAQCKKQRQKREYLYPKCVEIFDAEIHNVEWMDECFEKKVYELLKGAHVSQLSSFYCRYMHAVKKTVFFARFLRDEL